MTKQHEELIELWRSHVHNMLDCHCDGCEAYRFCINSLQSPFKKSPYTTLEINCEGPYPEQNRDVLCKVRDAHAKVLQHNDGFWIGEHGETYEDEEIEGWMEVPEL